MRTQSRVSFLNQVANAIVSLARPGAGNPCPICGSGRPTVFETTRKHAMLICRACRHLYWDNIPDEAALQRFYAEEYSDTHSQPEIQEGHRAYYREHVRLLATLAERPLEHFRLVDYGSSIPTLVREAASLGCAEAVAVDVDEQAFAYARTHGLNILTPEAYKTSVPDGSLDAIRFSHVLEHLPDPHGVVATAVAKLRPGGVLYITQPGFPIFQPIRTNWVLKDSVYPKHLHFFSPLSLRRMLEPYPVDVFRMYTHPNADQMFAAVVDFLDLDYSRRHLADWESCGEAPRGVHANYPYYCGENSELFARKRQAGPMAMH